MMLGKNRSSSVGLLLLVICTLSGVVFSGCCPVRRKQIRPDGPVERGHNGQAGRQADAEAGRAGREARQTASDAG